MAESLALKAMRPLGRREYTRYELGKKLSPQADSPRDVQQLLDDFEEKQWIDDRRYTEAFIRTKRHRYGMRKIFKDLEVKGVAKSTILEYREEVLRGDFDAVKLVWAKKYSARPTTPMEWAKQARFLAGRGFDSNVIRKVLTDPEFCVDTIDCYE